MDSSRRHGKAGGSMKNRNMIAGQQTLFCTGLYFERTKLSGFRLTHCSHSREKERSLNENVINNLLCSGFLCHQTTHRWVPGLPVLPILKIRY
jgi:hypothetical protein